MSKLLEKLKAKWKTPEGKKELEDFFKKYEEQDKNIEMVEQRYFDKFNTLPLKEKQNIVDKIIEKYESDKYKDKEYSKGYILRNDFYYVLLNYAEKYGEEIDNNEYFCTAKYLFCEKYIISEYCGQGTLIKLEKREI